MTVPPPQGTVERWAWDYLHADTVAAKLSPTAPPDVWEQTPPVRRVAAPVRPGGITVIDRSPRTPTPGALRTPSNRARLFHTFLHHEVQAAELMLWALLAFPDTPAAFRRGLLHVCQDELRHVAMYETYLRALGEGYGAHPVRDWFWQRVPAVAGPAHYAAVMGVGFEGANLDHTARFAAMLRDVGDTAGAAVQDTVREEEVPHVRFALHWLGRWGVTDFTAWAEHLPRPLSPWLMRGRPVNREDRARAGLDTDFVTALEQWTDPARGC